LSNHHDEDFVKNSNTSDPSTNPESGTLLYSTIKVYQLKAGTLEKIVEYLTNENGDLDTTHMNILFSTYRTFTSPKILVDALISRYRTVLPASLDMTEDVRQKTIKSLRTVIQCLLKSYKEDFDDPPRYSTLTYLMRHLPDREVQTQCQNLFEQFKRSEDQTRTNYDQTSLSNIYDQLYQQHSYEYIPPWNFLDMSSATVAQQLTLVDAELLKRVLPYECLNRSANNSSRRTPSNQSGRNLSTVDNTIEHFNAVVTRVVATILKEQDERRRANVIEKWIDVAFHCRQLRNFSSLTAILNGLLSGCIFRLNTAWSMISSEFRKIFEDLKKVFGNCNDRQEARAILEKQLDEVRLALPDSPECLPKGTAKYEDQTPPMSVILGRKFRHKHLHEQQKQEMIGTVPYLGLYLSDLTYIDSAFPNTINIENNTDDSPTSTVKLINFEKHRKEFEVLAQIKLFQSAANSYTNFQPVPRFKIWFDNVRTYTESESWDLSYEIEPKETTDNDQTSRNSGNQPLKALSRRFPSQVSLESLPTSNPKTNNGSTITTNGGGSLRSSPSSASLDKLSTTSTQSFNRYPFPLPSSKTDKKPFINHSRSSSASSFLTSSNGSSSQGYVSNGGSPTISTGYTTTNSMENDTIITKVQVAGRHDLLYKKVRINNNERTASVLKTILEKFGLDPAQYDRFCIEQKLPDRKILIPDNCNVYYALDCSSVDDQVELMVREKTRQEREQKKATLGTDVNGHHRTPSGLSISSAHSR